VFEVTTKTNGRDPWNTKNKCRKKSTFGEGQIAIKAEEHRSTIKAQFFSFNGNKSIFINQG
jgi:hypothetical protein